MLQTRARARGGEPRSGVAWSGCALALLCACGSAGTGPALDERDQQIIRGSLAESAELDHTGALVTVDPQTGERLLFCTATLIAAETVVTAKHCALAIFRADSQGLGVAWLAGPSVDEPTDVIPIVAAELAPVHQGGFLGIGRDVAVAHLERPTAIAPAEPRSLGEEQIGESMISIGYGIFSPSGTLDSRRRIGHETVAATGGRALEAIFGSFENYVEWTFTGDVTDANFLAGFGPGDLLLALILPSLRADFDSVRLLDGYEAVTGRASGDTQTCSGDSGGPLARRTEQGAWLTYGVVSGGLYSAESVCDYGSVFATFGPETLAFLEQSQAWVDPCADVGAKGGCEGARAVRCETSLLGAQRQLVVTRDCAVDGQECFLRTDGAACHEPTPQVSTPPTSAAHADAPEEPLPPDEAASDAG